MVCLNLSVFVPLPQNIVGGAVLGISRVEWVVNVAPWRANSPIFRYFAKYRQLNFHQADIGRSRARAMLRYTRL